MAARWSQACTGVACCCSTRHAVVRWIYQKGGRRSEDNITQSIKIPSFTLPSFHSPHPTMAPHPWRPPQKKRRPNKDKDKDINPPPKEIPKFAYIQAYEANLVYNRVDEAERAQSFNRGDSGPYGPSGNGEGLIQWAGDGAEGDAREVWADRYVLLSCMYPHDALKWGTRQGLVYRLLVQPASALE